MSLVWDPSPGVGSAESGRLERDFFGNSCYFIVSPHHFQWRDTSRVRGCQGEDLGRFDTRAPRGWGAQGDRSLHQAWEGGNHRALRMQSSQADCRSWCQARTMAGHRGPVVRPKLPAGSGATPWAQWRGGRRRQNVGQMSRGCGRTFKGPPRVEMHPPWVKGGREGTWGNS